MKVVAIIPAAGTGSRIKSTGVPKQFFVINGRPLLDWTLEAVSASDIIEGIYLVVPPNDIETVSARYSKTAFRKICGVVAGGETRAESVSRGVLAAKSEFILIHDAARPFVTPDIISNTVNSAFIHGASTAALPVSDTLKGKDGEFIGRPIDRESTLAIQTPQVFKREILIEAYETLDIKGNSWTDETSLVAELGKPVAWVMGSRFNIKVTTEEDLEIAGKLL